MVVKSSGLVWLLVVVLALLLSTPTHLSDAFVPLSVRSVPGSHCRSPHVKSPVVKTIVAATVQARQVLVSEEDTDSKPTTTTTTTTTTTQKVEFPPPLSSLDRLTRAATFWSTALPIVANYYGLISRVRLQELTGQPLTDDQVTVLWDALHEDGAAKLADTITDLKGFYVKTAQIIASRQDLFPVQYTEALSGFTDNLDPMPAALARAVVESELLNADETFDDVFAEFDAVPLGAASVAQCHRAVLTEKYGGKQVAVKIQRPSIEAKLLGDVANLKAIAKTFRDSPTLPLDYYTVMCELEKSLADEFDFVAEAVAMDRIYQSLIRAPDGSARALPLVMPRPVPGLVSKRVLVMDYLHGVPLSRAREEMIKKGIDPDGPEAKLFGRKLLTSLTAVFGRNILETGFFHAVRSKRAGRLVAPTGAPCPFAAF